MYHHIDNMMSSLWMERDHFLLFVESLTDTRYGYIRKRFYDFFVSERGRQLCAACAVYRRSRAHNHKDDSADGSLMGLENEDFDQLMLSSIFCPVLPGDGPTRIKFTHAIVAGCLPVVIEFPSYVRGFTSWWKPYGAPYQFSSVPFSDRVNYTSFVVTIPWRDSEDFPEFYLHTLLSISDEEIRGRQMAMARSRHFNLYDWSGSQPDAFTAVLDRIVDILDDTASY